MASNLLLASIVLAALCGQAPAATSHLDQRFAQANQAHDGHLTLEEAKAGFPIIASHFASIDIDGKGFVTESDIRTWYAARKAAHAKLPADDTAR
jgi:hypothetical protein